MRLRNVKQYIRISTAEMVIKLACLLFEYNIDRRSRSEHYSKKISKILA